MINGGAVDPGELDEVTLRSGELALRQRVIGTIHSTIELEAAAMTSTAGIAAHVARLFSGKFRSLEGLCQHIRDRAAAIQSEMMATEQALRDEERSQASTPALSAKHRATRRAVLNEAQAAFAKIALDEDLRTFFREGAKVVQNQQFRTACVKAAALIGIAVLAAATGGVAAEAAGSMLMQAEGVATVAELSTAARVGATTANLAADSAVNAIGQRVVQGGSLKQAFVENLMMSFASTALFGTIARASAETARLEGRQAMTWAKAETFMQKALVVGNEAGAITVHTVWGAAIGYVAHRAVSDHEPSPMEARDWLLQGASVAIGRGIHKSVGERLPSLERLAKRSAAAQRLLIEARQLQQLASTVVQTKNAASAVELFEQRTRLLREEIEAIEDLIVKQGDASGALGKSRNDLVAQLRESNGQAMVETKLHLLGLEELVPGALWKGSPDQVQHALAEARRGGGHASQDPRTRRWKLILAGRELAIQEVDAKPSRDAASDPRSSSTPPDVPHHRGGRYGVAGDMTEEALRDPHPTPEMLALKAQAREAHPFDVEGQRDYIHRQFGVGTLRQSLLLRRASLNGQVSKALRSFGIATATHDVVARVFDYVFDSSGIGFNYESYAAWCRLADGRGTVADVRFFVHEATEIGIMTSEGVDFMGKSVTPKTAKHLKWFDEIFEPAYDRAHARALYAEYQFLAERVDDALEGRHDLSPEIIAAVDPASDEGRNFMAMPDGMLMKQHPDLPAWKARGGEQVEVSAAAAERLHTPKRMSLAELILVVRNTRIDSFTKPGAAK